MSPESPYTFLMNGNTPANLEKINAIQDAQIALDDLLEHASRTTLTASNAIHVLESIIGAWTCLNRACEQL